MVDYANSITNVLNVWADMGVFAYVLPFLMIFALVFGLLNKSRLLGDNKGVQVVIALAVGLMSLQFDYVANFFATIFPYAGIGMSVLLVALILMGIITEDEDAAKWIFFGIGAVILLFVLGYTFYEFSWLGGYAGTNWIPMVALILIIAGAVVAVVTTGSNKKPKPKSP